MKRITLLTMLVLFSHLLTKAQSNVLPPDGNVGIGIANPEAKLQIIGSEEDSNGKTLVLGNINGPNLRFGYHSNYTWMQSHGGRPLYINYLGNDVLFNLTDGNVGIGSITPAAKLDVRGTVTKNNFGFVRPTINVFSNDAPAVGIGGTIAFGGRTGIATPDYTFAFITGAKESEEGDKYAGYFAVNTVSGGDNGEINSANYERLRITSIGNVGIGTTSPKEKLSVNGNIRAREIKVETANWPDYVFEKEYMQLPLPEVEKFIKLNKHLPGIPSSAEVQKEGIELGEMNKKLLLKIEELTLSVIDLHKHVSQLQLENENIRKSIKRKNK